MNCLNFLSILSRFYFIRWTMYFLCQSQLSFNPIKVLFYQQVIIQSIKREHHFQSYQGSILSKTIRVSGNHVFNFQSYQGSILSEIAHCGNFVFPYFQSYQGSILSTSRETLLNASFSTFNPIKVLFYQNFKYLLHIVILSFQSYQGSILSALSAPILFLRL